MKRFLLLFAFLSITIPAHAALLIEPVVGYSMGLKGKVHEATEGAATLSENDFSGGTGPSYGGRLGYQKLGFQVGLDYLKSSIDPSDKKFKGSLDVNEWAAFVGFEFPILFRVYGGYIFSSDATGEYDDGGKTDIDLKSGTGFKAGVGFTLLPFLDINFEYRKGTFTELKAAGIKFDTDVDYNVYMIGLSLPFTI